MNRKLIAELIGTFTLIFIGAGSMMTGKGDLLVVALAHGFAIAVMVAAVGGISGGHFNPAVTSAFLATKRIALADAVQYIVAQLIGAALAAIALKSFYGDLAGTVGGMGIANGVSTTKALLAEAIGTFLLMVVIFGTAVDKRGKFGAGFPIGLTISAVIFVVGPITGAALNPARWFGPALATGSWTNSWVWIAGPILGAVVAALAYQTFLKPKE